MSDTTQTRRRTQTIRPDLIDIVTEDASQARELRSHRGFVKDQLARATDAIFHPVLRDYGFSVQDRALVALYLSLLHRDDAAIAYFTEKLESLGATDDKFQSVEDYARATATAGPYGRYPAETPLAGETDPGPEPGPADASVLGDRLAVGLAHAHLLLMHPRDTQEHHIRRLRAAAWTDTQIVILTQIVSVLSFVLRVAVGLRAIAGVEPGGGPARTTQDSAGTDVYDPRPEDPRRPTRFTSEIVAWEPWILSTAEDENPGFDWKAVFGARRASSPSFRLSARDPLISLPLSRIEDNVFSQAENGLDRGERELGALAVSRLNGCLYCASVHARTTIKFTGEEQRTERILANGLGGDHGERWQPFIRAAVALTKSPPALGAEEIAGLRGLGLDDLSILDFVHSVGYFNFANRIMLGLGDPVLRR